MASAGEGDDPLRSSWVVPEALRPGPTDRSALAVVEAEFFFDAAAVAGNYISLVGYGGLVGERRGLAG